MAEFFPKAHRKSRFACMAKGGMSQIVSHSDGFRQILVQIQRPGNGSGNTADLDGMGHTGAIMVTFRTQKHLGFVHQTAEGLTMDNSVRIPLIAGTHIQSFFLFLPVAT